MEVDLKSGGNVKGFWLGGLNSNSVVGQSWELSFSGSIPLCIEELLGLHHPLLLVFCSVSKSRTGSRSLSYFAPLLWKGLVAWGSAQQTPFSWFKSRPKTFRFFTTLIFSNSVFSVKLPLAQIAEGGRREELYIAIGVYVTFPLLFMALNSFCCSYIILPQSLSHRVYFLVWHSTHSQYWREKCMSDKEKNEKQRNGLHWSVLLCNICVYWVCVTFASRTVYTSCWMLRQSIKPTLWPKPVIIHHTWTNKQMRLLEQ